MKTLSIKAFAFILLTLNFSDSFAGNIDLDSLKYDDARYSLIAACNGKTYEGNNGLVAIFLNKNNHQYFIENLSAELVEGMLPAYDLGDEIEVNTRSKFKISEREGGIVQYEKIAIVINKKTSEGELKYESQILGDIPFPQRDNREAQFNNCTFAK